MYKLDTSKHRILDCTVLGGFTRNAFHCESFSFTGDVLLAGQKLLSFRLVVTSQSRTKPDPEIMMPPPTCLNQTTTGHLFLDILELVLDRKLKYMREVLLT